MVFVVFPFAGVDYLALLVEFGALTVSLAIFPLAGIDEGAVFVEEGTVGIGLAIGISANEDGVVIAAVAYTGALLFAFDNTAGETKIAFGVDEGSEAVSLTSS